jgi:diamine N-acetyltransferase
MAFLASGQDYQLNGQIRLMILLDNEAVGMLDFFNSDFAEGSAETGIIIVEAHRRKGIAPAAYRLGFRLCKDLGIHKLRAVVEHTNGPAIQLYHSLAFHVKQQTSEFFQFLKVI